MDKTNTAWALVEYIHSDGRPMSFPASHLEIDEAERIEKLWKNYIPHSKIRIRKSALGGYCVEREIK